MATTNNIKGDYSAGELGHPRTKKHYDVIIIGGSISGSITAAYLAQKGVKVAVFETTNSIGGPYYGQYTKEGGYKNEFTSHLPAMFQNWMGGYGNWVRAAMELKAPLKYVFVPNNSTWGRWLGDVSRPMILPYCTTGKSFARHLNEFALVPYSQDVLDAFAFMYDDVRRIPQDVVCSQEFQDRKLTEYIKSITDDENVLWALERVAGTHGAETKSNLDMKGMSYWITTNYGLPDGGFNLIAIQGETANAVPMAFAKAAMRDGAEYFLGHRVKELILDGDVAKGVYVAAPNGDNIEVRADRVVISTHIYNWKDILGWEHIPKDYVEMYKDVFKDIRTTMDIHYGLKERVVKRHNFANIMLQDDNACYDFMISVPSEFCDGFCPPGKQLVQIEMYRNASYFETENDRDERAQYILDKCDECYPGFKDAVEWTEVIMRTPIGNHELERVKYVPNKHPELQGVYFTGTAVQGPWFPVTEHAASTAMVTKDIILKEMGLADEHTPVEATIGELVMPEPILK